MYLVDSKLRPEEEVGMLVEDKLQEGPVEGNLQQVLLEDSQRMTMLDMLL